jgi:HEAT repeat protein
MYIGNGDPALAMPIIKRMLQAEETEIRERGGGFAAFAGMEWGEEELLASVLTSPDVATRKGVAAVCAHRLPHTTNAAVAERALTQLVNDDDDKVRAAAAEVAGALRDERLRPFAGILMTLISSDAYSDAVPQLLITLEHAPDRVDALVTACARRFVDVHGADVGNIATGAAGDAREVGQLVFRAYAQASSVRGRSEALDLIDQLLALNAYGMTELVDVTER